MKSYQVKTSTTGRTDGTPKSKRYASFWTIQRVILRVEIFNIKFFSGTGKQSISLTACDMQVESKIGFPKLESIENL